ncbi:MAG TPA: 6-phosphogluconolactonase [Candidatus Eremiobacteraceae bacterium]|nr:6-phosphogluconolactonase [Candidatus Eremiobacteraceae bacterium]
MGATRVVKVADPLLLAKRAADEFAMSASAALHERARFAVALSGGKTPHAMLETLATRTLDWPSIHFFWSDERCVAPDDPSSNYGMARNALLSKIAVPKGNVHRMRGELDPLAGASAYDAELRAFFGAGAPVFDLLFLGLGTDGHTASLFPGTAALGVTDVWCAANQVSAPVASPWRLTLTYPAINAARRIIFLVEGADKSDILANVLGNEKDVRRYPAQGIAPTDGELVWLVDSAAAANLPASSLTDG